MSHKLLRLAHGLIALCLAVGVSAQSTSLTTLFARDNGTSVGGAVYFDLTVQAPLTITGFDVNSNSVAGVAGTLDVHLKSSTHVGFTQSPAVWTLAASGPMTALGVDRPTSVTLASPIVLSPGTYGMALHYVGLAPAYTNGTVTNQVHATADLTFTAGSSQTTFLSSPPITPRVANVTIYYTPAPPPPAPVVINEFSYDDTGGDDREFVELYNRSGAPFNLGGWELRYADASGSGVLATIPGGTILPAGGFWLIAQPFWATRDQALAAGIPDGAAAIALYDGSAPLSQRIDSVTYEDFAGLWQSAPREGSPLFPEFLSTDGFETSWSRVRDGHDTNRNAADFRIARATPKASNNQPVVTSWTENADALVPGTTVAGWHGSRAAPLVVSAASVALGLGTLPPSPQSPAANDRCIQFDAGPTQGASYWLESDIENSVGFDGWVYLDTTAVAAPAHQAWSIGVRGGTGSEFAWPAAPGSGVDENGDRGVTWTYRRDSTGSTLYLLDHASGGRPLNVLAIIPIFASGWQRLSIHADAELVEARFGGTVGNPDGTLFRSDIGVAAGNLYVGVRNESITAPLWIDDFGWDTSPTMQLVDGGPGCQGNCFFVNGEVTTIADSEKVPTGRYAFLMVPSGTVSFTHVCFFTSNPDLSLVVPTVSLHQVDTSTNPNHPGALIPGATAALTDQSSAPQKGTWWAAPVGLTDQTAPFYIVLNTGTGIRPPLAAEKFDAKSGELVFDPERIEYLQDTGGDLWTFPGSKQPWAISFVCADQSGFINAKRIVGDLVPGTSFTFQASGGAASLPMLGFLGLVPIPPLDLALLGAPGCTGYTSPILSTFTLANTLGTATWGLSIPASPAMTGVVMYVQWAGVDVTLNPLGLAISGVIQATIQ